MATRRSTLLTILKMCATLPFGVSRRQLFTISGSLTSAELNRVRDTPWPDGLKHLVSEERLPTKGRNRTAWIITSAAREWLRRLSMDDKALPLIPVGQIGYQSMLAKQYAARTAMKACKRKKRIQKYQLRQKVGAKHHGAAYDQAPAFGLLHVDVNSEAFRKLVPLQRIQILRAKVRAKQQS